MDLIPQSKPDITGEVLRSEFKNTLNSMGFHLDDNEFGKLWNRYVQKKRYNQISRELKIILNNVKFTLFKIIFDSLEI